MGCLVIPFCCGIASHHISIKGALYMALPELEYQGEFLTQFTDIGIRGEIAQRFYHPARYKGYTNPEKLVRSIVDSGIRFITSTDIPESKRKARLTTTFTTVLRLIRENPEGALEVAAYYIDRQNWDDEKKSLLKMQQLAAYGKKSKTVVNGSI